VIYYQHPFHRYLILQKITEKEERKRSRNQVAGKINSMLIRSCFSSFLKSTYATLYYVWL